MKLNENTKVTLTLGQIRRLIKESYGQGIELEKINADLLAMHDVPNYLKEYIREQLLLSVYDGFKYNRQSLRSLVKDLKEDRVVTVESMIWNDGDDCDDSGVQIPNKKLPLKFSLNDINAVLRKMFPDRDDVFADAISIEFREGHYLSYYWANECYQDSGWRESIDRNGSIPIKLSRDDGDAIRIGKDAHEFQPWGY